MTELTDSLGAKAIKEEEEDHLERPNPPGDEDDLFGVPPRSGLGDILAGNDDLFSDAPSTQECESGGLRDMLAAGDADADLFGGPPAVAAVDEGPPSAIVEWQSAKDQEIRQKDEQDSQFADSIRTEADEKLQKFNSTLRESQAKRAILNHESDQQKLQELDANYKNPWEKVVKLIDFTQQDFHVRDVSRLKTLLIHLKQNPLVKS
jgi:hypothetical protein